MESPVSPERKLPIKIKKLHFLIHPGYNIDPYTSNTIKEADDPVYGDNDERLQEYNYIFDRYSTRAKELPEDELVIALYHKSFNEFLDDFKKGLKYTQNISTLKTVLGKRLIVVGHGGDEEFARIKKIISSRGYSFTPDVESEAIGEFVDACVPGFADDMNRGLELSSKTLVNPKYSSEFEDPPTYSTLKHLHSTYRNVEYKMDDFDFALFYAGKRQDGTEAGT